MSNPELRKARFDLLFREYEVITLHNKKWKFLTSELAKNKICNIEFLWDQSFLLPVRYTCKIVITVQDSSENFLRVIIIQLINQSVINFGKSHNFDSNYVLDFHQKAKREHFIIMFFFCKIIDITVYQG